MHRSDHLANRRNSILVWALGIAIAACSQSGLSSEARDAAGRALKSLRKLEAATQVGVNYQQYSQLVIDAKAEVNDAHAHLPEGDLRQELEAAMDAYADAREGWGALIDPGYLRGDSELGKKLIQKYGATATAPSTSSSTTYVDKSDMLQKAWHFAGLHLDIASNLLK